MLTLQERARAGLLSVTRSTARLASRTTSKLLHAVCPPLATAATACCDVIASPATVLPRSGTNATAGFSVTSADAWAGDLTRNRRGDDGVDADIEVLLERGSSCAKPAGTLRSRGWTLEKCA